MAAKTQNKGLGRGLNVFFENAEEVKDIASAKSKDTVLEKVVELKMADIEPMLNQPRKQFDEEKLQELADSIRVHGVIQPILVEKDDDGYKIIAGERRWRASKLAGKETIPAIVKDYTASKKKQVALIENIQREDLNVMEVATALRELMEMENYTTNELAKITGKNASTVSNTMRLLKLNPEVQKLVMEGKLFEAQARPLLVVKDEAEQVRLANYIIEKKLTKSAVERLVYNDANTYNAKKNSRTTKRSALYKSVEDKLTSYFGVKTRIDISSPSKPKLVLEYVNDAGLESILEKLNIQI